jgi:F-type H+-transporting ATPase subunit delta
MRDFTRGFVAAVLEQAAADGALVTLESDLETFQNALVRFDDLRFALTDGSISLSPRRAIARDLLVEHAPLAYSVVSHVLGSERPADLPLVIGQAALSVREEMDRIASGAPLVSEPHGGRWAVQDRIRGYAEFVLSRLSSREEVARIEDELFAFVRAVESSDELREILPDGNIPLDGRGGIVEDLLQGKASPATIGMLKYQLRAGRVRDIGRALGHLVELAAAELGRRLAEVRAPVELGESERLQLEAALALMTGRPVEVRVIIDPTMIGGMLVNIGDTLIDGTVRRRLEQLRESLDTSAWTAA